MCAGVGGVDVGWEVSSRFLLPWNSLAHIAPFLYADFEEKLTFTYCRCTFTPRHGEEELGWKPQFGPEHILETAAEEVDLILENLKA